jgi:hypothetical protein
VAPEKIWFGEIVVVVAVVGQFLSHQTIGSPLQGVFWLAVTTRQML